MPIAMLTLKGDRKRLSLPFPLNVVLNSLSEKALSAATFCCSAVVNTRSLPVSGLLSIFLQAVIATSDKLRMVIVLRIIKIGLYLHDDKLPPNATPGLFFWRLNNGYHHIIQFFIAGSFV